MFICCNNGWLKLQQMLPSAFRPQGIRTALQTKTDKAYEISFKMTHITEKNKKI